MTEEDNNPGAGSAAPGSTGDTPLGKRAVRILLSGFEPFGLHSRNISQEVVERLASSEAAAAAGAAAAPGAAAPYALRGVVLPVTFESAWGRLEAEIREFEPELVIALGLAEDRRVITPEFVAINFVDARIADNDGAQPREEPIVPGAPQAYFSTLPAHRIARGLGAEGFPAEVSYSAGTYVCNYLMYRLLHALAQAPGAAGAAGTERRGGFIHLPGMPGPDGRQPRAERLARAIHRGIAMSV